MQDEQPEGVRLTLADGRKVLADGRVVSAVPTVVATTVPQPAAQIHREIVSGRRASRTLEKMHRKLGDLPDTPQKMNPIAAVMGYSAIGLNNADIAAALGATEAQIETIKNSVPYKQFVEMFDQGTFDDAKREARHIIAQASNYAAETMVNALGSGDESVRVVAAREVMKTAGISLEHESHKMPGGLKIVIEKSGTKDEKIEVSINNMVQ